MVSAVVGAAGLRLLAVAGSDGMSWAALLLPVGGADDDEVEELLLEDAEAVGLPANNCWATRNGWNGGLA